MGKLKHSELEEGFKFDFMFISKMNICFHRIQSIYSVVLWGSLSYEQIYVE